MFSYRPPLDHCYHFVTILEEENHSMYEQRLRTVRRNGADKGAFKNTDHTAD